MNFSSICVIVLPSLSLIGTVVGRTLFISRLVELDITVIFPWFAVI